jgi:hypothetical protein
MNFTEWLEKELERQKKLPHDFGAALDSLRYFREASIKQEPLDFWKSGDPLYVLEKYVYERATPEEMHARAEQGRNAMYKEVFK